MKKNSSAKKRKIGVAVIGCGGRGQYVAQYLLRDSGGQVQVLSCYDPDPKQAQVAIQEVWQSPDVTRACSSYVEAIETPGVDWVMVFSPNAFHKEHILSAFARGKHVFTEKPLATTIADCEAIDDASRKAGVLFATGFVLRYAPIYRKVKELLDSGKFGRIIGIDANENLPPHHGVYIMRNWRRHSKISGPHILEKCCHDLDLLNWYVGDRVSRVAAFGGRDFFVSANKSFEKDYPNHFLKKFRDPKLVASGFEDDTDLMDNLVAVFEYRNHVRAQFQATMSNAIPERRIAFSCERGNIFVELYASTVSYQILNENQVTITFKGDGHGGGDDFIMKELFEGPMTCGTPPACSGSEGLESAVLALGIDKAARTGKVVDLEPVWRKMGR